MSKLLTGQALLDWLEEEIREVYKNGDLSCAATMRVVSDTIKSGRFDAPEQQAEIDRLRVVLAGAAHIANIAQRELRERSKKIERLRAAAIKLHETLNTYWQGDCDKADVVAVQSKLCDVLGADRDDELYGDWTDERCPKCGANLLGNKVGDKWCSMVGCDYGLRETDRTVDESRACGMDCPNGRCE